MLLLGDVHFSWSGSCGSQRSGRHSREPVADTDAVHLYLDRFLSSGSSERPVDVFLESKTLEAPFSALVQKLRDMVGAVRPAHGPLHRTFLFFHERGCLSSDKTVCEHRYPHGRVHFVDRRDSQLGSFFKKFYDRMARTVEARDRSAADLRRAFSSLKSFLADYPTVSRACDAVRLQVNSDANKANKQVAGIQEPSAREAVSRWLTAHLRDIKREYRKPYERAVAELGPVCERSSTPRAMFGWFAHAHALVDVFMFAGIVEMDVYAMGRLLRSFSDGSRPERSVVYAGDAHIQAYEKLLTDLGWHPVGTVKHSDLRCLSMRGVPKIFCI